MRKQNTPVSSGVVGKQKGAAVAELAR